jgi:predicted RNase H-like HicB family nuclease
MPLCSVVTRTAVCSSKAVRYSPATFGPPATTNVRCRPSGKNVGRTCPCWSGIETGSAVTAPPDASIRIKPGTEATAATGATRRLLSKRTPSVVRPAKTGVALLNRVNYIKQDDGTWKAEYHGLFDAVAAAETLERCRRLVQDALDEGMEAMILEHGVGRTTA